MTQVRNTFGRAACALPGAPRGGTKAGLTVVEVLVALVILGIVTAAVTTTYISSMRNNADAGRRTQSAQVLNALGRRVAGADAAVLAQAGTPLEWDYGELPSDFPELSGEGIADPDLYRATVTNVGAITLASAETVHYAIVVCTRATGDATERCVAGDTAGPPPGPVGETPAALPGIN